MKQTKGRDNMNVINKKFITCALLAGLAPGLAQASTLLIDQHNDSTGPTSQGYTTGGSSIMGQSFSPTAAALDTVELQMNAQSYTDSTTVHVDIMTDPTGTILGSSNSLTFTGNAITLGDFQFATPIDISSYSSLFISVVLDPGVIVNAAAFTADGFGSDTYAGGMAYLDNAPCCSGYQKTSDLWFRTGLVSTVPVPAAAWLFGSGLIGLIGVARRKNNNA
jgi:hypothetical protein